MFPPSGVNLIALQEVPEDLLQSREVPADVMVRRLQPHPQMQAFFTETSHTDLGGASDGVVGIE